MNKILVLLLISFASFAQTEKGMFTAGNRVFNFTRSSSYKSFSFSPTAGFLVGKNTEFGVGLNSYFIDYLYSDNSDYSEFNITNYVVKYFGRKKAQPYLVGGISYGSEFNMFLGAGVQYFVIPTVAVSFSASIGQSANVGAGFSFYIPRKK